VLLHQACVYRRGHIPAHSANIKAGWAQTAVIKAPTCSVRVFCTCRQESEGRSSVRTFPCLQSHKMHKRTTSDAVHSRKVRWRVVDIFGYGYYKVHQMTAGAHACDMRLLDAAVDYYMQYKYALTSVK
jgi:hypothetical protein